MSTPGFAIPAAAWSLATEFGIIGVCVAALLWRLAAPKTPFHVYITVWLSWSFALALVALVPLDLNLVYLERCLDHFGNNTRASAIACPLEHWRFSPPPPPPHPHPPQPPQTPQPPLPPQPGEDVDDEDAREPPSHEDDLLVVQQWKDLLHGLWLTVYAVTMAHGWVILNFQSAFNESRQFTVFKRFQQCFRDNVILVCIASACNIIALAVIIVLNLDLYYIIYGMMAVTNAICLVVVAFLVGFGCAVVPRALWHASHLDKSLRKCMREVASLDVKYNESATDLAAKMVAVYQLRRAAASSMRTEGDKIMQMVAECPLDVAAAVLMDPVRGPSIPSTSGEVERAFLSHLHEIELDQVHKLKMTEVDRWLAALEAGGHLPQGATIFLVQEAMFGAGLRRLGDIDHLDPGVKGGTKSGEGGARAEAIGKQLDLITTETPIEPALRVAIVKAVVRRNDNTLRIMRDDDHSDERTDPMAAAEKTQFGFDPAEWDVPRLVKVRVGIRRAARRYRKTKAKFDRAVTHAIRLQDLGAARQDLADRGFGGACHALWNALLYKDQTDTTGWRGVSCPVHPITWGLRVELLWFLWECYFKRGLALLGSVLAWLFSTILLLSQLSLFPPLSAIFQLENVAWEGSLLHYSVCTQANLPPGCGDKDSDPVFGEAFSVRPAVQWVITVHLFLLCSMAFFTLTRLKIFSLYEIVAGETEGVSLCFNAFVVCRVAPSMANNYLSLLHEVHETGSNEYAATVFETTFARMGTIPFIGTSFHEVLPPIILVTFIIAASEIIYCRCCPKVSFLGSSSPGEGRGDSGKIVDLERLRHIKSRATASNMRNRTRIISSGHSDHSNNGGMGLRSPSPIRVAAGRFRKGVTDVIKHVRQPSQGDRGKSIEMDRQGDRHGMLSNMETGGEDESAGGNERSSEEAKSGAQRRMSVEGGAGGNGVAAGSGVGVAEKKSSGWAKKKGPGASGDGHAPAEKGGSLQGANGNGSNETNGSNGNGSNGSKGNGANGSKGNGAKPNGAATFSEWDGNLGGGAPAPARKPLQLPRLFGKSSDDASSGKIALAGGKGFSSPGKGVRASAGGASASERAGAAMMAEIDDM